jgi:hypothetical protein
MHWGVASGSSIKALRIASRGKTVEDHGWTVDGSQSPAPGYAEISYTTGNADQIFAGPVWFVDCGGFTELSDNGQYDYAISEYVEYLARHARNGVEIKYALRDWPITNELLREYGRSERTHQRWSIRDHVKTLEIADDYGLSELGCEPMSVIQGVDTARYLRHLDYFADHGLLTDHVCLGSLKPLSPPEVQDVAEAVRRELPTGHTLHGLGMTYRHLRHQGVREAFDSVDTQSWNKARSRLSDEFDAIKDTWIGYLRAYEQYAEQLVEQSTTTQDGTGTQLFEFGSGKASVAGHYDSPIRECVCGTTLDPNAIRDAHDPSANTENTETMDALDTCGCRHCRRSILNLRQQHIIDEIP